MKLNLSILAIITIGIIVFILYNAFNKPIRYVMRDEPSYQKIEDSGGCYGVESFMLVDKEPFSMPSLPGKSNAKKDGKKSKADEGKDEAKSKVKSNLEDKKQEMMEKGKKYSEKANQVISKINNKLFGWLE